jgi:Xaa-Pro aminopeptidase
MRTIKLVPAPALAAAVLLAGAVQAQSPDRKDALRVRVPFAPTISVDDIVARILSFDKDKKGKVTKNDLPERMQFLVDLGDTNKDGALDPEEIRALVARRTGDIAREGRDQVRVGPGAGPTRGLTGVPDFVNRPDPNAIEKAVEDLRLSGGKKEQAMAAVKAHKENLRKLMEQARAELCDKMRAVLSEEELNDFKAAMDRPRRDTVIIGSPTDAPPGGRKDGALDPDEIRALVARRNGDLAGGGRDQVRGGPGAGPTRGFTGVPDFVNRPDPNAPDTDAIERAVEDLRLSGGKKEQATAAVKAHKENLRKLMEQARAELIDKMRAVLSKEELNDFKAAMDRPRRDIFIGSPTDAPPGGKR